MNRCSSLTGNFVRAGSTASVVGAATAVAYFVFTQNFCPKRDTGAVTIRSQKTLLIDLRNVVNTQSAFTRRHIRILTTQLHLQHARIPTCS